MTRDRRFAQLDVFTTTPTRGNPLAVVVDGQDLSAEDMAAFARWTNLSETTYLLPPTDSVADYRVRIFTPGGELPFAGHPTLGSCRAWLDAGGRPHAATDIIQECGVGLVRIRPAGERLAFQAPTALTTPVGEDELAPVLEALGLSRDHVRAARWLVNGPRFLGLLLDSAATVLALEPDHGALKTLADVGLAGAQAAGSDTDLEVRVFVDSNGIPEDPVTGSFNASLGQWLIGEGLAPERYVVAQGTRLGRSGRVHVAREQAPGGDHVWIGGDVTRVVTGTVRL